MIRLATVLSAALAPAVVAEDPTSPTVRASGAAAEIERITAALARDYGVAFAWQPWQVVPRFDYTVDWADADDLERLARYVGWLDEEWRKLPPASMPAMGLEAVWLVEEVDADDGERAGYPDVEGEVLVLAFPGPYDVGLESYYRTVVHHELFHMLEEEWSGDVHHHDEEWAWLNPIRFRYDPDLPDDVKALEARHPAHGFVSHYAMTAMVEDRAEVWSLMLVGDGWRKLERWRRDDPVLAAKVALLESFARTHCEALDAAWWRELRTGF